MSHYNKFFDGFQDWSHMHDRVWYLRAQIVFRRRALGRAV